MKEVSMGRTNRSGVAGWLALVSILTVGLLAAGCGSSKKTTTTTAAALTKAAFLKKANAICKRGNQQIGKVGQQIFSPKKRPSQAQTMKFVTATVIPSVQSQIDQIRALGAPAGDQAKVNAIVTSAQSALDKGKKDPALLAGNGPGPFKKTNQLGRAYGLTVCGSGGG
jgi:hypothetical protein